MKLSRSQILTDVRRALEVYLPDRCEQLMQSLERLIPESESDPRMAFFTGPANSDQETLGRMSQLCEALMSDTPPTFYVLPPGWRISWTFVPALVNLAPTVYESGPLNRHAIPQQNREVRGTRFGQVVIDEARDVDQAMLDVLMGVSVPPRCGRFEHCHERDPGLDMTEQGSHHDIRCPLWTAGSGG